MQSGMNVNGQEVNLLIHQSGKKTGNSAARAVHGAMSWLDQNTERYLMVAFYAALALIISVEVARRYITGQQTQWGSTVSIYCFIWLSWLGCAYHVKSRTHLRFEGVRAKMPRLAQAALFLLDDVLWLLLASIVLKASLHLMRMQIELGGMIEGTNVIPMAFATAAVPVGWSLIVLRAVQDMWKVIATYRRGGAFTPEFPAETA